MVTIMTYSLLSLILLSLSLLSIFAYQHSRQELNRMLTATSAIISLIFGLALAHWSIQLIVLILILNCYSLFFEAINNN
jgi:uncharacterized membrane protein HdeD (DUF308 family)